MKLCLILDTEIIFSLFWKRYCCFIECKTSFEKFKELLVYLLELSNGQMVWNDDMQAWLSLI